jgi:nicotinic acid mononucleotide adenylyltransferase
MAATVTPKTAFFAYGRFQPPTLGHGLLFKEMVSAAAAEGADAFVFPTSTQGKKTDPLSVDRKVYWLQRMYGELPIRFVNTTTCEINPMGKPCKTIFQVLDALRNAGYTHLRMYVGSDRVKSFTELFKKYESKNVEPVTIVGSGKVRNASSANLSGMSGTKMREAALRGNTEAFKAGTGFADENASALMAEVRAGMAGGKRTQKVKRVNRRQSRRRNV